MLTFSGSCPSRSPRQVLPRSRNPLALVAEEEHAEEEVVAAAEDLGVDFQEVELLADGAAREDSAVVAASLVEAASQEVDRAAASADEDGAEHLSHRDVTSQRRCSTRFMRHHGERALNGYLSLQAFRSGNGAGLYIVRNKALSDVPGSV